ncbi:class I SAM-dependent methyltransferase [Pareuzebyella sediminis]|uniref:class I SAM-dependent methyltransferase n=1 Tax=Pareuzebyella sediminis TaxID=2607998 RepID=UPI0011F07B98|nr:class I SAM-dependent methyltransferase [Pareuzebyella sediminis]
MDDLFGSALLDYQQGGYSEDITIYSSLDEEDELSVPYLFRNFDGMPKLEQKALSLCKGKVLDIGAGAGSHSLFLQKKGYDVTALDYSKGAVNTCMLRGIKNTVHADIYHFENEKFDTLLLLMNGIGIVGEMNKLGVFFQRMKSLLNHDGQILLDSSDIIYMFEKDDDGGYWVPDTGAYYGEVEFYMEYRNQKSNPFKWLYIDYRTLQFEARANGLNCELVQHGEHYDYLARLWPS